MATFTRHIYIPPELIDEICSFSEIGSLLCLMRTSKQLHVALSYNVYRTASVSGLTARQFFATLGSGKPNAPLYASAVQRLTYRGSTLEDAFITFPLFVNALLKMYRLRTLEITVGKAVSAFLTVQLDKTGINRQCQSLIVALNPIKKIAASILALPSLTAITIHGDHTLTSLAKCRQLTTLKVGHSISIVDFSDVMSNLVDGKGGVNHHLTTLEINLLGVTSDETAMAIIGIAELSPLLTHLTFRVPLLNPLMLINMMASKSAYLPKLRVMLINTNSEQYMIRDPQYASQEDACKKSFIKSLRTAGEMRPQLHHVQFGLQEWGRISDQHSWKSTHHLLNDKHFKGGRSLRIIYHMKLNDSKEWNWVDGAQENLCALLKI